MVIGRTFFSIAVICIFTLAPLEVKSQKKVSNMYWGDLLLNYAFDPTLLGEVEFAHHFIFDTPEKAFYEYSITPLVEIYPVNWLDLILAVNNTWTRQAQDVVTYEFRPFTGFRLNFIQKGYTFRSYFRFEYRRLSYVDSTLVSETGRARARIELIYPLNTENISLPKTLYTLLDAELFADFGEAIPERFSNKRRLRAGLGWRFSRWLRFEFIYINQQSRNTRLVKFERAENIYRTRLKWLIHRKDLEN